MFKTVTGYRYLTKVSFDAEKERHFWELVYHVCYASAEKFESMNGRIFEDHLKFERGLFGDVDESVPFILSEEGFLSSLLKPSIHQHHGYSTASLRQLVDRLLKLEEYWNVSFDILITEREPLELLHAYYAQMYHILSNVSGLSTFKDYIQAGVSNEPSKDLGFRYLKPGVVTKAFVDGFGADRVFTIPMKKLFEPGCVRLGLWHPSLSDVPTGTQERENSRSVGKDTKITHRRPIWVKRKPFKLRPFLWGSRTCTWSGTQRMRSWRSW
ncbi:MAG: hypothetical protein IPP83_02725 [Flavobacteriales bacterium]|nr:hypothetical protein [Flavobacteriales bacterium]